jgi:hypothetical protein
MAMEWEVLYGEMCISPRMMDDAYKEYASECIVAHKLTPQTTQLGSFRIDATITSPTSFWMINN